jgi:predicted AAA+ superfamily ATPase
MLKRYLEDLIIDDALASKKIAFISGPRQVGKTTLAKSLLKKAGAHSSSYFTWIILDNV